MLCTFRWPESCIVGGMPLSCLLASVTIYIWRWNSDCCGGLFSYRRCPLWYTSHWVWCLIYLHRRDDVCTTRSFQAYNLSWDKNLCRLWGRPVDGRWTNLGDEVHIACMLWPGKRMNCFITYNFLRNINELIHIYVSIRISVSLNKI